MMHSLRFAIVMFLLLPTGISTGCTRIAAQWPTAGEIERVGRQHSVRDLIDTSDDEALREAAASDPFPTAERVGL
mgnify:CR=1 FL=1